MVHFVRIILAISIVVFAVNNVTVDAGEGKKYRKKNLEARAFELEEKLKPYEDEFKSKYCNMSKANVKELTDLNNIIIDHIVGHEQFTKYLKNVFEALQKYADGQIKERFDSLETVYKKWENENFPNKELKDQVKSTLIAEGKIKVDTEDKTEKKIFI